jgi:predicted transcriptional regulator
LNEKILNGPTVSTIKGFIVLFLTLIILMLFFVASAISSQLNDIVGFLILIVAGLAFALFHYVNKFLVIKKSIHLYKITDAKYLRFERMLKLFKVFVTYKNEDNIDKEAQFIVNHLYTLEAIQNQSIEIAYRDDLEDILIVSYKIQSEDQGQMIDKEKEEIDDNQKEYDDFLDKERYKL